MRRACDILCIWPPTPVRCAVSARNLARAAEGMSLIESDSVLGVNGGNKWEAHGRRILNTGYWILDTGYWILDTGYWILDTGYWMLGTGH